jgi:hypothetical protein
MTSAADLFALQEIDLERDRRRALIADIDARLGETEELREARQAVADAEESLAARQKRQREIEGDLADLDHKIRPLEEKLYGGSIRNPKELTDLQHEIDLLKRRRDGLDDQGLANLEAIEAATAVLAEARSRLAAVEAAWRRDQESLRAQRERAESELASLARDREARTAGWERTALARYETLRSAKQGRPVARIERGACGGCRITLPTHIVQRARVAGELVNCPSCERILVAG